MGKKRARWAGPDIRSFLANLAVTDDVERGNAVRGLCPCHVGWDVFEQHVGVLIRRLRDPSRLVRRQALHVFEDAVRMQSTGDLQFSIQVGEEKIGEKRTCHFRSMEERLEARRDRKNRKRKRRHQGSDYTT